MKVLIVHHLEPEWATHYPKCHPQGWEFYDFSEAVANHIVKENYDQVILTQFTYTRLYDCAEYFPLYDKITVQYEYGYGWDMNDARLDGRSFEGAYKQLDEMGYVIGDDGRTWARGGAHSELVLIDDWMETLPKNNVHICGAFDGQCIEDLEKALEHLEIKYERIEELIV